MVKMKPDIKKIWLKALRSGEYRQTTCSLNSDKYVTWHVNNNSNKISETHDGEGYCCLGVLANELLKRDMANGLIGKNERGIIFCPVETKHEFFLLSQNVLDLVGMNCDQQSKLSTMNDTGHSFTDIANHIERKL